MPLPASMPPPRVHRHRYFGMLAPNAQLRAIGHAEQTVAHGIERRLHNFSY